MRTFLIALIAILAISCSSETHDASEIRRVVRPVWGVNQNIKTIRWVDTMYQVGDTIRLDIRGLSSIPEAIIVK